MRENICLRFAAVLVYQLYAKTEHHNLRKKIFVWMKKV